MKVERRLVCREDRQCWSFRTSNLRKKSCRNYYAQLRAQHVTPAWIGGGISIEPRSEAVPYLWRWRDRGQQNLSANFSADLRPTPHFVLAAEIGPAYSFRYSARGVGGASPTSEGYAELAQPTAGALRLEPAEPLSSVVDIREKQQATARRPMFFQCPSRPLQWPVSGRKDRRKMVRGRYLL
jgi:hypothetical protein